MIFEDIKLAESELFAERYKLVRQLGRGGMGAVYLVQDTMLSDELVALKLLHAELCHNEKHSKRFLREVQLTRRVTHPNVVRTFDVGGVNGRPYFTMEFAEGQTLKERLLESALQPIEAARIVREICRGLAAIHEADIIHRDLKPGNVILGANGLVKITDFGVAKPGISDLTGFNEIIGSIPYMAPEVWVGRGVGPRADLYALGVIFYETLTGHLPFEGEAPAELMCKHLETLPVAPIVIRPEVPQWCNDLVLALLEKEQTNRPATAVDLAKMLDFKLDGVGEMPATPNKTTAPRGYEVQDNPTNSHFSQFDVLLEAPPTLDEVMAEEVLRERDNSVLPGAVLSIQKKATSPEDDSQIEAARGVHNAPIWFLVLKTITLVLLPLVLFSALYTLQNGIGKYYWTLVAEKGTFLELCILLLCNFVAYAAVLAAPILVLNSIRRSLTATLTGWFKFSCLVAGLLSMVFAINVLRLEVRSYQLQLEYDRGRFLSAAKASIQNVTEAALLMPQGTAYQSTIKFRYPVLVEATRAELFDYAFYALVIFAYVVALLRVLERWVFGQRNRKVFFIVSGLMLLAVMPIGAELALRSLFSEVLAVHLFKNNTLVVGSIVHEYDDFSLVCSVINWTLVVLVVHLLMPRFLNRLKTR